MINLKVIYELHNVRMLQGLVDLDFFPEIRDVGFIDQLEIDLSQDSQLPFLERRVFRFV